jgi:hypothetical protein
MALTRWEYGYAHYDGVNVSDIQLGNIGLPMDIGFGGLLHNAGQFGWEFCGSLPEADPKLGFGEYQGPRQLVLIFKRPRSRSRS